MVVAASTIDADIAIVFVDIAIIMIVARLMGALFRRLRQPAVVGEILAGIALGPTLLGAFPGDLPDKIFPPGAVREYLAVLAQLGLIIFMFIVGLELDMKLVKGKERLAGVISLSSIILPFGLGLGLAVVLHDNHDSVPGAKDFWSFALFIGASMSVTAFPVLARILTDRGMQRTAIGALALACAAVDDIVAWSLLAVVVAKVESSGVWDLPRTLLLSVVFVTAMFVVVKPQLAKVADRYRHVGRLTPGMLSVVLVGVLVSSFITERIGIHAIFGPFLFGVIMPREATHDLFREILERLEQVSVLVLLPVFFIATGLGVDVGGLSTGNLVELALILVVACVGKFVGAAVGARLQGVGGRKASAIGVLMNTRGLTELVILNIGVSKGVLDGELFTMLVIMAVLTTVITEPLLRLVYSDKVMARDIADAERAALGVPHAFRVLLVTDGTPADAELLEVALAVVDGEDPSEVVVTRFQPFPRTGLELGSGLVEGLGDMADSLAGANDLAAVANQRAVATVVLSQFSDDPARDVLAQAVRLDVDVILVDNPVGDGDAAALVAALRSGAECEVVVREPAVHDDTGAGVTVTAEAVIALVTDGRDTEAALDLSVRLALAGPGRLVLVRDPRNRRANRRADTLQEQVGRLGLPCTAADEPPVTGGVVVVGANHVATVDPPRPRMVVRSSENRGPDDLANRIDALVTSRQPVGAHRATKEEHPHG